MTRAGGKGRARIAARAEGAVHQNVTGVEGKPPHHLGKENRDMGRGGGNGSGHALPPFASICARTMRARRGSEAPFTSSRTLGFQISKVSPAAMKKASLSSRSEEHTSELQSLMRISYAVFCL